MCIPEVATERLAISEDRITDLSLARLYDRPREPDLGPNSLPIESNNTSGDLQPHSPSRLRKLLVGVAALATTWGLVLGATELPAEAVGPLTITLDNKKYECSYEFGTSTNYNRAAYSLKNAYERKGFGTIDESKRIDIIYRMEQHKWELDEASVECHVNPNAPAPTTTIPKTEQPAYKAGQGAQNVAKGAKESADAVGDVVNFVLGPGNCLKYGIDENGNCYRNDDYYVNDVDSASGRTIQCQIKRGRSANEAKLGEKTAQLTADQLGVPVRTDYRAFLYGQLHVLIVNGERFSEEGITCYDITSGTM